jgi:hypothetical protein
MSGGGSTTTTTRSFGMKDLRKQRTQAAAQGSEMPLPYRVRRRLERFQEDYGRRIERPDPTLCSESVEALKGYVEEIETFCEAEIESGRITETPEFWAAVYLDALISVSAKVKSLVANAAFYLGRTGRARVGERETFVMLQQQLSILVAKIERKLIDARKAAKRTPAMKPAPEDLAKERSSRILPLLRKKGWSVLDWATESRVDYHTAVSYLKAMRKPYASTLQKLAKSLAVPVESLV